jgi:hypothetical protein
MFARKEENVSPSLSSESASSFSNLRWSRCNDSLNPTPAPQTTTTDAGAAMVVPVGQQQLRERLRQYQMHDGKNANIGTSCRSFPRRPISVHFTMRGILLLPFSLLISSCTMALVYHNFPTNIVARRVANIGTKIDILSTTSSSLFYKYDFNDSCSDSASINTSSANANKKNGGDEGGNNSSQSNPVQFARAKRARKLHRHPSKKAKKKSGKELRDDIIVELIPSTFLDDYVGDDEQTPFILSEPGEGETWVPPRPPSSSSSTTTFSPSTSFTASTTSESCSRLDRHPALVLNADYQPLRMLPLSIWSWQDTIKAVLSGKAVVVDIHPNIYVRAVSLDMPVPSVIALREYAPSGKAVRKSCRICSIFPIIRFWFSFVI